MTAFPLRCDRARGPFFPWFTLVAVVIAGIFQGSQATAQSPTGPLSPEAALAGLKTDADLRIEIAAAEPDVIDPVFVAFDPRGRMWVVQMGDYPNGPDEGEPGRSSIRVLTDDDGDGRFTNPVVFADGLLFANSLMFWQDGVLVTTDGRVDFLADRDGDGKAEFRETWFEGFTKGNPQLRANSPTLGLDGLIYVANGLRGGKIVARRKEWGEHEPVDISGRDFCFDPFTGRAFATSGHGQFGMSFDDFGRRFVCSNRNPCIQVVIPEWALLMNRDVAVTAVVADAAVSGEASRIYPISKFWTTSNLHAGQFTAACGVHIFRGDGLRADYRGNAFTCDPTGNLVHRELLEGDGVVFKGRSPYDKREFLASEDTWFRPVSLTTGPDGALYVADMYRAVIEHPEFMPDELKKRPDLLLGTDRGRIYRIIDRRTARVAEAVASLQEVSAAALAPVLDHPNVWQREMAFRLLIERQDRTVANVLIASLPSRATPQGVCLALWGLAGLQSLTPEQLLNVARSTSNPDVLEQCLLLERLLEKGDAAPASSAIAQAVLERKTTLTARLRFHLALRLRNEPELLAELLQQSPADVWLTTAVLLASGRAVSETLSKFAAGIDAQENLSEFVEPIGRMVEVIGVRGRAEELGAAMSLIEKFASLDPGRTMSFRSVLWERLATGLRSKGRNPADLVSEAAASGGVNLVSVLETAARSALAVDGPVPTRVDAIRLLQFAAFNQASPALRAGLNAPDTAVASAAVATLSLGSDAGVGALLLENYSSRSPVLRREIQTAMFRSESRIEAFLDEIDAGRISATELDAPRLQQLGRVKNSALKERAAKLIAANRPADRAEVIERYQAALVRKGDPGHGRQIFAKNCTQCHRIGDLGVNVAPDISDSRVKQPVQILTDVLDPNRAIDSNYFNYLVVDREGTVHSGIIATETSTSVTLRQPEDKRLTLPRENIEQIKNTGQSLMPVGLEKTISIDEMSDLISFIKNWRYLDGEVPREVIR